MLLESLDSVLAWRNKDAVIKLRLQLVLIAKPNLTPKFLNISSKEIKAGTHCLVVTSM